MFKKTAEIIALILTLIDHEKEYSFSELDRIAREHDLTGRTFVQYACKSSTKTVKTEYTLQEVLKMLNACAGDDCYNCEWHFVEEGGKIYDVEEITVYKIKE